MGQYTEVRSDYIKNLIRCTNWYAERGRRYIEDLIRLQNFILDGVSGYAAGVHYEHLKASFRKEWEIIYNELNAERFKGELTEEKERKQHWQEQEKQWEQEEEIKRKDWIEAGGRL